MDTIRFYSISFVDNGERKVVRLVFAPSEEVAIKTIEDDAANEGDGEEYSPNPMFSINVQEIEISQQGFVGTEWNGQAFIPSINPIWRVFREDKS